VTSPPPLSLVDLDQPPEPDPAEKAQASGGLHFLTLAELCAKIDAQGPRRWLLRGLWPAGEYGVHSAEMKAQKTWNTVDLAVSVSSGTPWLGAIEVDDPGPVVMFAGEGSESNLVRRLRAVCAARDIKAEELPVVVCTRAPHLSDRLHLIEMAAKIEAVRPRLVTLDPFYLSARGAQATSLYDMGALLEGPQHICQEAGAALWVATHNNRKDGKGAGRISGAGPAEWGRVLLVGEVKSRRTDPVTMETTVIVHLDVVGGEIADQGLRVTRRIRSADPDDLDSPLIYAVTATAGGDDDDQGDAGGSSGEKRSPAARKLLEALRVAARSPETISQLTDRIVSAHGHGLTRETCSRELSKLADEGLVDRIDPPGKGHAALWSLVGPVAEVVVPNTFKKPEGPGWVSPF